ncbi:MAG: branched-chain amino acid ABC transporter permease [Pseudomonadota bacterium]
MLVVILQALVSGLAVGGIYALVALGFSITFTTTKTLNFSHGEFVAAGAFIGVSTLLLMLGKPVTASLAGLPIHWWQHVIAIIAAIVVMGLLGVLLYVLGVRPFAGKPGLSWVVSTIGFGILLQSLGLAVWGAGTMTVPSVFGEEVIRFFGAGIRPQEILVLAVAIVITVLFDWVMTRTMLGKVMRAVAHNRQVANLMGINVNAVMIGAFVISSALAGLSGILIAPITSVSLFMGLGIGLKAFSAAIIGGLSNPRGCVIGGFALGVLESMINMWQAQWREVLVFLIVILVLAIKPNGLFGTRMVEKV